MHWVEGAKYETRQQSSLLAWRTISITFSSIPTDLQLSPLPMVTSKYCDNKSYDDGDNMPDTP